MQSLIHYLSQSHIMFSVTGPVIFTMYWFLTEGKRDPPPVRDIWCWMGAVIAAYHFSFWSITPEYRSLHIVNTFFIYLAFRALEKNTLSPGAAYSLSFLCIFTVDVVRSLEFAIYYQESLVTFWWGIGGAGLLDGLFIFPFISALFVYYVRWRKRDLAVPLFICLSKQKFLP